MSIISLVKITFYGHVEDRKQILSDLQELGCLHLIPLSVEKETLIKGGPSSPAREALRFILSCPDRRRQVRDPAKFDAFAIEQKVLELKDKIQDLKDERDFLAGRIANLRPWGDFQFPPREALKNLRLWFYIVSHKDMKSVEMTEFIWEEVARDNRFHYVVVISEELPEGMPAPRVRTGNKSISELENRLEEVEIELEDLQAERAGLTRWCTLFAHNIDRMEDHAAVDEAIQQTYEEDPIFALQAWAPEENTAKLEKYAKEKGIVFVATDPAPEETPPTMMRNPGGLAVGQDLVSFYLTPKYWLWDPSIIVFFSFALFFAMIFADAGYSATLGLILAAIWKRMGQSAAGQRFRILMATLVGVGVAYGILVGSYFGVSPGENTFLARLKILDVMDFNVMMKISILLGVFHLVLANTLTAWHWRRSPRAVVPTAWIFIFIGAVLIWLAPGSALITVGIAAMGLGVAGIIFFTSVEGPIWKRLLQGLLGLTRFSNAFGDSLSYLRLFALGLASASLAGTFNDLSGQVKAAVPGIGLLFAILIVLLGHGLNFVLSLSSGVIHGMRLNCIEFFNWSISEEGYPFKAFDRKEKKSWKA
jgi:V/A-type H+-transporting ATPase subunit I